MSGLSEEGLTQSEESGLTSVSLQDTAPDPQCPGRMNGEEGQVPPTVLCVLGTGDPEKPCGPQVLQLPS